MTMPGFRAETSLYRTGSFYRGFNGAAGGQPAPAIIPSAVCGNDCFALCGLAAGGATAGCITALIAAITAPPPVDVVLAGVAFGVCEALGVGIAAIQCALNCPSCPTGPPPPPFRGCCPSGRSCSCGGRCVKQPDGAISCVGGTCLGPHEQCQ